MLVAAGLSVASIAMAATPTFSFSGVGADAVQITVVGDSNSTATLFYNVGSSSGAQVLILGMTDGSGNLSKAISVSALNLNSANSVYVMVNSQQSAIQPWSATASASAAQAATSSAVTFDNVNPVVALGGSTTVTISGGSAFYVSTNSNIGITSQLLSGNLLTISGIANGSTVLSVCSVAGVCAPLNVTVGAVSAPAPVVTVAPVVVATPAPTTALGTSVALLTQIQTMQGQLAQMLTAIQAMQAQLAKLASSAVSSVSSGTSAVSTPSASTVTATKITSLLKMNSTGSEVTLLQQKLTNAGHYSGPINGSFGPLTEAGLKKYQTAKGIEAAGYTGPATRAALNAE